MNTLGEFHPFIVCENGSARYDLLNKTQRQSLGKRHTNTRTLGTRGTTSSMSKAMVATGSNPSIAISRAPIEPPPIPASKDKWIKRIIASTTSLGTGGTDIVVPADLVGGFIDKIQVWGVDTRSVTVTFKQGNFTDLGADDIVASDYSSYAQLPGLTVKVPVGHAIEISGAANFSLLKVAASGDDSKAVVHYHAWVRY